MKALPKLDVRVNNSLKGHVLGEHVGEFSARVTTCVSEETGASGSWMLTQDHVEIGPGDCFLLSQNRYCHILIKRDATRMPS